MLAAGMWVSVHLSRVVPGLSAIVFEEFVAIHNFQTRQTILFKHILRSPKDHVPLLVGHMDDLNLIVFKNAWTQQLVVPTTYSCGST